MKKTISLSLFIIFLISSNLEAGYFYRDWVSPVIGSKDGVYDPIDMIKSSDGTYWMSTGYNGTVACLHFGAQGNLLNTIWLPDFSWGYGYSPYPIVIGEIATDEEGNLILGYREHLNTLYPDSGEDIGIAKISPLGKLFWAKSIDILKGTDLIARIKYHKGKIYALIRSDLGYHDQNLSNFLEAGPVPGFVLLILDTNGVPLYSRGFIYLEADDPTNSVSTWPKDFCFDDKNNSVYILSETVDLYTSIYRDISIVEFDQDTLGFKRQEIFRITNPLYNNGHPQKIYTDDNYIYIGTDKGGILKLDKSSLRPIWFAFVGKVYYDTKISMFIQDNYIYSLINSNFPYSSYILGLYSKIDQDANLLFSKGIWIGSLWGNIKFNGLALDGSDFVAIGSAWDQAHFYRQSIDGEMLPDCGDYVKDLSSYYKVYKVSDGTLTYTEYTYPPYFTAGINIQGWADDPAILQPNSISYKVIYVDVKSNNEKIIGRTNFCNYNYQLNCTPESAEVTQAGEITTFSCTSPIPILNIISSSNDFILKNINCSADRLSCSFQTEFYPNELYDKYGIINVENNETNATLELKFDVRNAQAPVPCYKPDLRNKNFMKLIHFPETEESKSFFILYKEGRCRPK